MTSSSRNRGRLTVTAPGARIEVLDAFLRAVPGSGAVDGVSLALPAGAYRVSARIAGRQRSRTVLVRPGRTPTQVHLPVEFDTAAPVLETATLNEGHEALAQQLTAAPPPRGTTSRLVVVLRGLRERPMADLHVTPEIYDAAGASVEVPSPVEDALAAAYGEQSRVVAWSLPLAPGGVRLRWQTGAQTVETALWLARRYQTVLFVPQGPQGPVPAAASVHLVPLRSPWVGFDRRSREVEVALTRARSGTVRPDPAHWYRVLADPDSPVMLVLLGLHELVRAQGSGTARPARSPAVGGALARLHRVLAGCPDVEALEGALGGRASRQQVTWPPMLGASLDLLLAAERVGQDPIAAGSLAEEVSGQRYLAAPWLLWNPAVLPSAQALGRVRDLVAGSTRFSGTTSAETARALGADGVAERLGLTTSLARASLETLDGAGWR